MLLKLFYHFVFLLELVRKLAGLLLKLDGLRLILALQLINWFLQNAIFMFQGLHPLHIFGQDFPQLLVFPGDFLELVHFEVTFSNHGERVLIVDEEGFIVN